MRSVPLVVALLGILGTPALAGGPFTKVKVGNWSGGSYTNDSTGEFSHCAASAPYKSGTSVLASVNRRGGWTLGFANPEWKLTVGAELAITLRFDGGNVFRVTGNVIGPSLVAVPMPDNSDLILAFRVANLMQATALNQDFRFVLTSTNRLLPALVECVKLNLNTVVSAPPPKAVPAQPSVLPKPPPDQTLQLEAMTMATNFLLASQIPGARVLKRDESPDVSGASAAWTAAGTAGQIRIIAAQKDQKGIDVAAGIVAADARECGGKFASGRTSELVDSDVVFRGFSSCEDSNGIRMAEYYVIPRKRGGFAVFSVSLTPGKASTAPQPNAIEEKRTTFQKAAVQAAD